MKNLLTISAFLALLLIPTQNMGCATIEKVLAQQIGKQDKPTTRPHKCKLYKPDLNGYKLVEPKEEVSVQSKISVVARVNCPDKNGNMGGGTAFPIRVYEKNGKYWIFFLTAHHVVHGKKIDSIELFQHKQHILSNKVSSTLLKVHVVKLKKEEDIAILCVESQRYIRPMKLSTKPPRMLQRVLAVGCPVGLPTHITEGIVSRPTFFKGTTRWLVSAPIAPGNSGGPVVDMKTGTVYGFASALHGINMGFSRDLIYHVHLMVPMYILTSWLKTSFRVLETGL